MDVAELEQPKSLADARFVELARLYFSGEKVIASLAESPAACGIVLSLFDRMEKLLTDKANRDAWLADLEANGLHLETLAKSYAWIVNDEGDVLGLVAGDMGFDKTGIKVGNNADGTWAQRLDFFTHLKETVDRLSKELAGARDRQCSRCGGHVAVVDAVILCQACAGAGHEGCRSVEMRLIEANRRLQQEGPALERDKLIVQLRERSQVLEEAIRSHRSQKADDRCIEDDDRLYAVLGDGIPCDRRVGDKAAMLANCQRFIDQRCEAGGWPTYAALEERLRQASELFKQVKRDGRTPGPLVNAIETWLLAE